MTIGSKWVSDQDIVVFFPLSFRRAARNAGFRLLHVMFLAFGQHSIETVVGRHNAIEIP